MGSCVSKKAGRDGAGGKVAAPLPTERESIPPPAEEEVKEVLSETPLPRPRPPEPKPAPASVDQEQGEEEETCEACSAAEVVKGKGGGDRGVEKMVVAPEKGGAKKRAPEQRKKDAGNGKMRPSSVTLAQRKQGTGGGVAGLHPARPRREQAPVVSGIGCRSGRFSPSVARRAAVEGAVTRTRSAREADTAAAASRALAKRPPNGNGCAHFGGGGAVFGRDTGERSFRRPDSPSANNNGAVHAHGQGGVSTAQRNKVAKDGSAEQLKTQCGSRTPGEGRDVHNAGAGGGEEAALKGGEEELGFGQNPSVAMECFIFL